MPAARWYACLCLSALAGAAIALVLAAGGWSVALDDGLYRAREYMVERRSDALYQASSFDARLAVVRIRLRSDSGPAYTDIGSTHLDISVDGHVLSVSLGGPESAPERIGNLARLVGDLAARGAQVSETWPKGRKCRIW